MISFDKNESAKNIINLNPNNLNQWALAWLNFFQQEI